MGDLAIGAFSRQNSPKRNRPSERLQAVRVKPKGLATVVTASLVVAGLILGALAFVVVRRHPAAPVSPNRGARTRPPPSAPNSPSSLTPRQALGPACLIHEVHGDFDGDGLEDGAFTWMAEPAEGCPSDPPFGPFLLTVFRAGNGERLELQMTDRCDGQNCGYLTKADLNGDGKSELVAVAWTGAADDYYRVFGLVDGRLIALPVARPGTKGYPAGAPIELDVGGTALIQSYVTCETSDAWGGPILLAHGFSAHVDQQGRERWTHTETAFRFDGRAFVVLYRDQPEAFPLSYDPSRDASLRERACWPALP